jgi:glutamate synthase domain-containing protein 1
MYMARGAKEQTEAFLKDQFDVAHAEEIPTRADPKLTNPPGLWRYFALPRKEDPCLVVSEDDLVVEKVMVANTTIPDAFIFSSGKDMGVFKGNGYPEDVANFYRLDDYQGYLWTAHGRFPTNTPGWWGGAHPFSILDWTVVHNGEISSYGINRRYLEMHGYHCTMQTDTEVASYAVDLLVRRHGLSTAAMARVLAPPLWEEVDRMPEGERELHTALRQTYGGLLLNGPFTIIIAHHGEMIGLTDRIRLRPISAAVKGDMLYLSSEESAITLVCPDIDCSWKPPGGQPVVGRLREPVPLPTHGDVRNREVARR